MLRRKYKTMFGLCLAGLFLTVFMPRLAKQYYPTVFCVGRQVQYYTFALHTWLEVDG